MIIFLKERDSKEEQNMGAFWSAANVLGPVGDLACILRRFQRLGFEVQEVKFSTS